MCTNNEIRWELFLVPETDRYIHLSLIREKNENCKLRLMFKDVEYQAEAARQP